VTSPGVTSPGVRYRSSSAKTAAPPKSALAKPKSGSSSAAPKHAHVVVPDASKTTPPARSTAGMQYSTCQHLEHSSTVQHPDGKTLRCDSDDWPVPVVLADRFALLSCVNCRRHRRHNCIVCPLPPHQLTNWSFVQRPTFITPLSPVLQAALCLAPLLSASAPPLTPFAAATAAAATTADLLSSVTPPPPFPCRPDPAWLCCRALQHHPEAAGWRQPWPHPLPHQGQGPRGSSSSRSHCCRHRRRQCCQQGTQPQEGDGSGSSTQVRPLQLSSPCVYHCLDMTRQS
jgi:hypothetical protein